jgi:GNAT superfamily N-acetyltransferase
VALQEATARAMDAHGACLESTGAVHPCELETIAADRGLHRLRLTVREDLVEARRLYERAGYVPVEPFSTSPYADHFLGKTVSPA